MNTDHGVGRGLRSTPGRERSPRRPTRTERGRLETPTSRTPTSAGGTSQLRAMQREMLQILTHPLAPGNRLAPRLRDGRRTKAVAAALIKPNNRLSSVERLEIYARCYWFRIIDSAYEDCPGLRALLGDKKFGALVVAFLRRYPSRSFTLRNLCRRLPDFLREEPRWSAPQTELAIAVAQFEWAQTVAFDGAARPPLAPDDIVAASHRLKLSLQPYLSLLALDWPVDDYVIAVKRRETSHAEASNTIDGSRRVAALRRVRRPKRERCYVVVHRRNHRIFYKRIEAAEYAILSALAAGRTLSQSIAAAGRSITAEHVRRWFATWTELGWLCRRE